MLSLDVFVHFMCSSTHNKCLELVPSCSSSACIRALSRFSSRRVLPSRILSDNASYFVAEETQTYTASATSWWGGERIYERIIQSIKRCLIKLFEKSKSTYECVPLTISYHLCFLRIFKVSSMLHHGSLG